MHLKDKEDFFSVRIDPLSKEHMLLVKQRWDRIAKPLDSLGEFEDIFVKIGGITHNIDIDISKAELIIMCADNGIVKEGVTQTGNYVTQSVAKNIALKKSISQILAQSAGVTVSGIDIGMATDADIYGIKHLKVLKGTRDFLEEPALNEYEVIAALNAGMEEVRIKKEEGRNILLTGEMGIGNTTTSSALVSALTGKDALDVTGRGSGLEDEAFYHKIDVIDEGVKKYALKKITDKKQRAFESLKCVGGLDIAGLCGICMGGALYHVPVIVDGFISLSSALAAEFIMPGVKDYLIFSHRGKERGISVITDIFGEKGVIDANLCLGEGSGALMMYSLLKMAGEVYEKADSFNDMGVKSYKRYHV